MKQKADTHTNLQVIPGVGPSITNDLFELGYVDVESLKNESPEDMYNQLCNLRGQHVDRCVLYVFRCAVYYASNAEHSPDKLKWWNWKDK